MLTLASVTARALQMLGSRRARFVEARARNRKACGIRSVSSWRALSLDQRGGHRVRLVLQDRTQRLGNREVRCETGAVPATVTGKQPSENHSQLPPLGGSTGKAEGSVDPGPRETIAAQAAAR